MKHRRIEDDRVAAPCEWSEVAVWIEDDLEARVVAIAVPQPLDRGP